MIAGQRIRPDGALLGAVADLDNLVDPAAVRLNRSLEPPPPRARATATEQGTA